MSIEDLRYLEQYGVNVEKLFREDNTLPQPKTVEKPDTWPPKLRGAEIATNAIPGRERHERSFTVIEQTIRNYEG